VLTDFQRGRQAEIDRSLVDQYDGLDIIGGQVAPCKQFLSCLRLDGSKLKGMILLMLQDKDKEAVTQVAQAVEQNYFLRSDAFAVYDAFKPAHS
jgi:hypothetical protein